KISSQFELILKQMLENTDAMIASLEITTIEERNRILQEWNSSKKSEPPQHFAHSQVMHWSVHAPDAVALVCGEKTLTYKELSRRAKQLAGYLQRREISSDKLVGISIERSIEMIVGILGVLEAGGAYVAMDPDYPEDRVQFMLKMSQPTILLTLNHLAAFFRRSDIEILCLDTDWHKVEIEGRENPAPLLEAENLAYVIFTSGSTGQPKGVQVTHRGLSNLRMAQSGIFKIDASDRVLQFSSLSFDASISDIIMALSAGAALHLFKHDTV